MSEACTKDSNPAQSSPIEVSVYSSAFLAPSTFKERNNLFV